MNWNLDSHEIDRTLGVRVWEIEAMLLNRARDTLPSLQDPGTIQTPYAELMRLCRTLPLKKGEKVVDFGAGYGRPGPILFHEFLWPTPVYEEENFSIYSI